MSENESEGVGTTRELPTHQSLALLRESPVGRVTVFVGGKPDIFPVSRLRRRRVKSDP